MAIRQIRREGDAVLRKKCREVTQINDRILELIDDMFETMYDADGVGLAAPQVGVLKNIVVIDAGDEEPAPLLLINPQIVEEKGEQTGEEGCLSLPGLFGIVTRPNYVKVRAYNEKMEQFELEAEDLLARAICHECDHLKGVLYRDVANGELKSITEKENKD